MLRHQPTEHLHFTQQRQWFTFPSQFLLCKVLAHALDCKQGYSVVAHSLREETHCLFARQS